MPFPNIKTSDLRNSAQIPLYNTKSSIPVLNIDPIRQGPTFITPEEEIMGRWAGSLINTMANNGMNHAGPADNLFGLLNGSGGNFIDDTGTIKIDSEGLVAEDNAGRSYSISTNGDLGYTQAFNNGKTSAGVTVNPLDKSIYGEFSLGDRDPVKKFTGIEGLPTIEVSDPQQSAAQEYLSEQLKSLIPKYSSNAGKPNF